MVLKKMGAICVKVCKGVERCVKEKEEKRRRRREGGGEKR